MINLTCSYNFWKFKYFNNEAVYENNYKQLNKKNQSFMDFLSVLC